jgi:hypothetical protein
MTFELAAFLEGLGGMSPQTLSRDVMDLAHTQTELRGIEVNSQPWQERVSPAPADTKRMTR